MAVSPRRYKSSEHPGLAAELQVLRDSKWARALTAEVMASAAPCREWVATRGKLDAESYEVWVDAARVAEAAGMVGVPVPGPEPRTD